MKEGEVANTLLQRKYNVEASEYFSDFHSIVIIRKGFLLGSFSHLCIEVPNVQSRLPSFLIMEYTQLPSDQMPITYHILFHASDIIL